MEAVSGGDVTPRPVSMEEVWIPIKRWMTGSVVCSWRSRNPTKVIHIDCFKDVSQ